jgi:hypothetical protein
VKRVTFEEIVENTASLLYAVAVGREIGQSGSAVARCVKFNNTLAVVARTFNEIVKG